MTKPRALHRCFGTGDPLMQAYHDDEWGVAVHDDRALFEKLLLDSFQAGLSWRTILHKREHFRTAFHAFDPERIARYTARDRARLLADAGADPDRVARLVEAGTLRKVEHRGRTFYVRPLSAKAVEKGT